MVYLDHMTTTEILLSFVRSLSHLIVCLSAAICFCLRQVLIRLPSMELHRNVKARDVIAWK